MMAVTLWLMVAGVPGRLAAADIVACAEPAAGNAEHVRIAAPDGVELAGTLYLPSGTGPFPAIVFAHGAGQYPRQHVFAAMEAGRLVEAGYAFLVADKRGVGDTPDNMWKARRFGRKRKTSSLRFVSSGIERTFGRRPWAFSASAAVAGAARWRPPCRQTWLSS